MPPDVPVASAKVRVEPVQIAPTPVIEPATGVAFTVMRYLATAEPQAPDTVYFMVSVPADAPVTTPVEFIVALLVVTLLQLPPEAVSVSVMVLPVQTADEPAIVPATGNGKIVIAVVASAVPQLLVLE